jgi:thiosulfate/3-mercaptopyruvate sulfurtransferase
MSSSVAERGYARPELLAETGWLAGRLSDPTLRIIDARADKDFAAGHIPGAVNISGFSLGTIGPDFAMGFAERVGALGIDAQTPAVVYDGGGPSQLAGMIAWALRYYGHADVRYLDGGMAKWVTETLPTTTDTPTHEARTFTTTLVEDLFCSLDQAKAGVADGSVLFWDVRSEGEFDGSAAGWNPPPRLGHMPGAILLDYVELFDIGDGTIKTAAELTTLLAGKGITPESTVATY